MCDLLLANYCNLLERYLPCRQFQVLHEKACSSFFLLPAGEPQRIILKPLLNTSFTADIPITEETLIGASVMKLVSCQKALSPGQCKQLNMLFLIRLAKYQPIHLFQ